MSRHCHRGQGSAGYKYVLLALISSVALGQSTATDDTGTSTDLFVMFGSDLVRPGLVSLEGEL